MKRAVVPVALLVVITGFCLWWYSPKQVVKRRVMMLLNTLTLEEGSNKERRKMGVYSLNGVLAEQVELSSTTLESANGTFDRHELESVYTWLCDLAEKSEFELVEYDLVEVEDDGARVKCTLEALVELPDFRPADGTYEADFVLDKSDYGWRISSARWVEK